MARPLAKLTILVVSFTLTALTLELALRTFGYENQAPYVTYLGRGKVDEPLPGVRFVYRSYCRSSKPIWQWEGAFACTKLIRCAGLSPPNDGNG